MYSYAFTSHSKKDFTKLPPHIQKRIIKKLEYFIQTHDPLVFAKKLVHYDIGEYRFRIGNYRIIFDVEDTVFVIHAIGHRREIYS